MTSPDMWGDAPDLNELLNEPKKPKLDEEHLTLVMSTVQRFCLLFAESIRADIVPTCTRRLEALGNTVTQEDGIRILAQVFHASVDETAKNMRKRAS